MKRIHQGFRLYVAGSTPRSLAVIRNLKRICEGRIAGAYDLEVVDVYQQPSRAAEDKIGTWKISVADNGIGIAPDYRTQIFGLFKRLHGAAQYTGSGSGLAICHRIVQRYGGKIWVESEPGAGSTFLFTAPAVEGQDA